MHFVIFTDLDGSLLDHFDYSFKGARKALEKIKERGIPLIFTTSKTRPEVKILQREMGLEEPFIVENGAAIIFPSGYRRWVLPGGASTHPNGLIQLGKPYTEIRSFVKRMASRFNIIGFGDLTIQEIANMTGLPFDKAGLAKDREFTEPFFIRETEDLKDLEYFASKENLKIARGGRFYHLMGINQDKGEAVKIVKQIVRQNMEGEVCFAGIGDSANDIQMLQHVDIPVLIPKVNGSFEKIDLPGLIRGGSPGSKGWNDTVESILDEFERNST